MRERVIDDPRHELRIELLGGFRVAVGPRAIDDGEWRLRKAKSLVKLLALAPGHRLHREQVMDVLWPDLGPQAAANQLRKAVHVARRAIDPDLAVGSRYLRHHDDLLALPPTGLWVDVEAFEAAAEDARRVGDPAAYREAIALYVGDLLPEDRYEDWVLQRQDQLRGEFVALLVELAGLLESRVELEEAVKALRTVVAIDPAHEEAHALLMRVHALAGRRQEALHQYALLREALRRELDVEPDVSTQRLFEEIQAGRAEEPELTAELWERVGDLRVLSGDSVGAVGAFRSGLSAAGEDAEPLRAARLHRKAAQGLLMHHDVEEAEPHLLTAEAILAKTGDEQESGRLLGMRANSHWEQGRLEDAMVAAEESLKIAERNNDPADSVAAQETLAIVFHFRGEWREGLHAEIERVGAAADDDPQLARVFDLHHCIGQYHLYGDRLFEGVEEYARHTLDLAVRKGARRAQAFAWCLLGESLLLRGYWDEAAGCLERSAELHEELGNPSVALPWQRMGELAVYRGDSEAAQAHLRRGMAIATVSAMGRHGWGRLYATAALDALERGDPGEAVRAVRSAATASARYGDCPTCSALLHPVAAEAHSGLGDAKRAAQQAVAAQQAATYWESSVWQAMAQTAAGAARLAEGDPSRARERFLSAADLYDRAGQPFWAARSRMQAALTRADGRAKDAQLLEQAAAEFARLGAVRAERRAREALAGWA